MMNRRVKVNCPYCGNENVSNISNEYGGKQIVICNLENGGCDRAFVADIHVSITATVLRIEGQGVGEQRGFR